MKKPLLAITLCLTIGFSAAADDRDWPWSPIGIGLAAPLQFPFMDSDVYGLRLGGFLGYNHDVYGVGLSVAEMATGTFAGFQASALSWTEGDFYGVQLGALGNVVESRGLALQLGLVNVDKDDFGGVQLGLVNYDVGFAGLQLGGIVNWNNSACCGLELGLVNANQDEYIGCAFGGLVNYASKFRGLGCSFVNVAYEVTGVQIGVFNACDRLHGVQFGLINMICESKLPIMVLANAWF